MIFGLDPIYYLFVLPGLLLAIWAQMKVHSAYSRYSQVRAQSGLTGAEAAREILRDHGLHDVAVEEVPGTLTDHYDPRTRTLYLSEGVYNSHSVAAVGVAAHEAGHAVQHANLYGPLVLRNVMAPAVSIGSNLAVFLLIFGALMSPALILLAIACFTLAVLFALVTLPVEFNASRRALAMLTNSGIIYKYEIPHVKAVLDAAALTYVAAALTAILQLFYILFRTGMLGGGRSED